MQIEKALYDPKVHDRYKALCVKQPYADLLTKIWYRDEDGGWHAKKSIEVRTRTTNYRGDLLICSSKKPEIPGRLSGVICGFVELYDVKPVSEFTPEDWEATCIPEAERPVGGYGWMMRDPRRVVEMPVKGQLGIYDLVVPKNDITEYLRVMKIDADSFDLIKSKLK